MVAHGQHFPVLTSNSSHYYPADSVFDNNILLSRAIILYLSKFLQVWLSNKEDCERAIDQVHVSITSSLVLCHAPGLVAVTKFKTMKLILRAYFEN